MFTTYKCTSVAAMALLGGLFCEVPKMVGVAFWKPGTTFADNFGKTDLDTLTQNGGFIGSVMPDGIENNDTEGTYAESLMKIRSQTDLGRKGWNLNFEKSPCYHNELNKFNNSEAWHFTPILEDGSIFAYQSADGTKKPFPVKMFVGLYRLPIMGVEEKGTVVGVDLLPKALNNWQNNGIVLTNSEIDFTEVNPVAGLNIEVPILTAGATTTVLKVSNKCSDAAISGLTTPSNWKVEVNGVLASPTAVSYNAANQSYSLTHPALVAADKVRFLLSENGQNVVAVDTNYYSGTSLTKTVA